MAVGPEVYAVASDDDGNDITSTVQRIKVLEPGDVVEPLVLSASASTLPWRNGRCFYTFINPHRVGLCQCSPMFM